MNKKILTLAVLASIMPMLAMAEGRPGMLLKGKEVEIVKRTEQLDAEKAKLSSTTATKAEKKAAMDERKQLLVKKLLDQTTANYNKLIAQIEDLAKRTATREGIMFDKGTLSPQEKAAVDAKLKITAEAVMKAKTSILSLASLTDVLVVSEKPGQEVKTFRQASNKVKDDIKAAHKAVTQAIALIKAVPAKERKSATSTPENTPEDNQQ